MLIRHGYEFINTDRMDSVRCEWDGDRLVCLVLNLGLTVRTIRGEFARDFLRHLMTESHDIEGLGKPSGMEGSDGVDQESG